MFKQDTYRIQIWVGKGWKLGLHDYTKEQAETRMAELSQLRIKCRIRPSREFFTWEGK